jgi:regulator of sigma E protease
LIVVSILIFLLILGVLVTVHEFGHFITAKLSGIRVTEFAIGMGPKLWKKQKGETLYSIRALPIGGFCSMGEDEEANPDDPHAFPNAKRRRRALVLAAGSVMNFLLGFLILLGLNLTYHANTTAFVEPVVTSVRTDSVDAEWTQLFQTGDRVLRIGGHAIYNYYDVRLFSSLRAEGPYDIVVERDGQRITLPGVAKTHFDDSENTYLGIGMNQLEPATLGSRIANAWYDSIDNVRLVWVSLGELFGGRAKVTDLMGPVGMANLVDSQVQAPNASAAEKVMSILSFAALIAINLAVMNMLPIPGLDGSRLLFLAVEGVRRKRLNPKYEGYVHAGGMVLLFAFMIFIFFNDIIRWITGGGIGA